MVIIPLKTLFISYKVVAYQYLPEKITSIRHCISAPESIWIPLEKPESVLVIFLINGI
jgi:hypothetical protein